MDSIIESIKNELLIHEIRFEDSVPIIKTTHTISTVETSKNVEFTFKKNDSESESES